jgi:hypothetical protein
MPAVSDAMLRDLLSSAGRDASRDQSLVAALFSGTASGGAAAGSGAHATETVGELTEQLHLLQQIKSSTLSSDSTIVSLQQQVRALQGWERQAKLLQKDVQLMASQPELKRAASASAPPPPPPPPPLPPPSSPPSPPPTAAAPPSQGKVRSASVKRVKKVRGGKASSGKRLAPKGARRVPAGAGPAAQLSAPRPSEGEGEGGRAGGCSAQQQSEIELALLLKRERRKRLGLQRSAEQGEKKLLEEIGRLKGQMQAAKAADARREMELQEARQEAVTLQRKAKAERMRAGERNQRQKQLLDDSQRHREKLKQTEDAHAATKQRLRQSQNARRDLAAEVEALHAASAQTQEQLAHAEKRNRAFALVTGDLVAELNTLLVQMEEEHRAACVLVDGASSAAVDSEQRLCKARASATKGEPQQHSPAHFSRLAAALVDRSRDTARDALAQLTAELNAARGAAQRASEQVIQQQQQQQQQPAPRRETDGRPYG